MEVLSGTGIETSLFRLTETSWPDLALHWDSATVSPRGFPASEPGTFFENLMEALKLLPFPECTHEQSFAQCCIPLPSIHSFTSQGFNCLQSTAVQKWKIPEVNNLCFKQLPILSRAMNSHSMLLLVSQDVHHFFVQLLYTVHAPHLLVASKPSGLSGGLCFGIVVFVLTSLYFVS